MNRQLQRSLLLMLCCTVALSMSAQQNDNGVVTQYVMRPQSLNSARKVAGEVPGYALVHLYDQEDTYGYFGVAFEYDRTFRPSSIAKALFGDYLITSSVTPNTNGCDNSCETSCSNDCANTILIQGTDVVGRDPRALRADDLYLPSDYNGTLSVNPRITNYLLDFQFYIGFDNHCKGSYLRVYAPFVHTNWNLNLCENVINAGTLQQPGSFTPGLLTNSQLLPSASAYFAGQQPATVTGDLTPSDPTTALDVTIVRQQLCASRMTLNDCASTATTDCCKKKNGNTSKNGFGEIRAELGWNWTNECDRHLGINIQAAAPTGTRPNATYLFQPIIGNGKHWELGGGVTGHYLFCRSQDESRQFGIFLDAMVTHLFKNTQTRTFDLINNGPLSRYMIAVNNTFIAPNAANLANYVNPSVDADTPPTIQTGIAQYAFNNEFAPVANLTKHKVKVSVGAQADISLWFNYTACNISWDLGYNFYGRTPEHITRVDNCRSLLELQPNTWTLKGDAHVYGFFPDDGDFDSATGANAAVALPVSESQATISCPAVAFADNNNQNVDNGSGFAAANVSVQYPGIAPDALLTLSRAPGAYDPALAIRMSTQPIFLSNNDINYKQRARIITNKIFTHFSYKCDRECWAPFFGVGGEVEFGNGIRHHCESDCNTNTTVPTCNNTAACKRTCDSSVRIGASQWGVWFKTGIAFN